MKRKWILVAAMVLAMAMVVSFSLIGCKTTTTETTTAAATTTTAAATTTTVAAATTEAFSPEGKSFQLVMILKGHPVHHIVQFGFLEGAKKLGYKGEILANDGAEADASIALGEAGLAKGTNGMVVWAFGPVYYPFINKLGGKGVPVIVPHFPIKEGEVKGLVATTGCDPNKYAEAAAEAIGSKIEGKGTVAITQGSFNTTENMVAETFAKYMKEHYPNVKVLPAQEEGFDPPVAISKAVAIIQANPDIAGALSTTGGGPTTWAGAKDETGKKDMVVIAMDYTRVNLDLVKSGKIYAIIAQPLYEEAYNSVVLLDQYLRTGKVAFYNVLEAPLVTADKLDPYYKMLDGVEATMGVGK